MTRLEELMRELEALLPQCLGIDRSRIETRLNPLLAQETCLQTLSTQVIRLIHQARHSVGIRQRRLERIPALSYPTELPITAKKEKIVKAIHSHPVVIVAGETGSGKTTQIPKMCLEAGLGGEGRIGCTQPRRVAALAISRRLAEELQVQWGHEIGCKIRFTDHTSPDSLIKVVTDGILLAEVQGDPDLLEYEAIIIDEAHERSLNIDFLLGHLNRVLKKRPELKLIITSATIDTEAFSKAFGGAPVIEVSGRLFPVETRYAPLDEAEVETGDITYIEAAVQAVEGIVEESSQGDILIFMPGEKDIREVRDLLEGRRWLSADIIPLYGRLSNAEQQHVFAPSRQRKIIIATNIAETSLTIPGIHYVVDSGLARISRYHPRTRTRRLPIEPVSQSSANQRMGRSGRVENGVCIRLYSEEDFAERPRFTQPEIQRANLAEVILRMKAWKLGEIESFPFINPPAEPAIRSGYLLLQELGALDEKRELTPLGDELARLPVDPTMGRMILQSLQEGVADPVTIIAAGLSIQDPRERPLDQKDAADQAHRRFLHPKSDFLTLLNIWKACHDDWERIKTQSQLRKFCRAHLLSYIRIREWRDIHAQLEETIQDLKAHRRPSKPDVTANLEHPGSTTSGADVQSTSHSRRPVNPQDVEYASIHRSILTGLLSNIAVRTGRNMYRASGNRQVMVFPGSSLFDKTPMKSKESPGKSREKPHNPHSSQPAWLVAGEMVETSQLFARTAAAIDPRWIIEVGAHLCRMTHTDPRWDAKAGRVLVREKVNLNGLEVDERWKDYGRINPKEATEIFIRSALIEEEITGSYKFLEHNRRIRHKVETWRTRMRHLNLLEVEEALFQFYHSRLENVSSLHDLNRVLKEKSKSDPEFLQISEHDLVGDKDTVFDSQAFPDHAHLGSETAPLSYAYVPGDEKDGVTVHLPARMVRLVDCQQLTWVVPGLREEQIAELLRLLPKAIRRDLMPLPARAQEISRTLEASSEPFLQTLSKHIQKQYGVIVPLESWNVDSLPNHLRPRIEVVGTDKQVLAAGRDFPALQAALTQKAENLEDKIWTDAARQWEKHGLTAWSFDDLPEEIEAGRVSGLPILGYPGLSLEEGFVGVKLYRTRIEAQTNSAPAYRRLAELSLQRELGWLGKDLQEILKFKEYYITLGPAEEMPELALENLKAHLFSTESIFPLTRKRFDHSLAQARSRLPGLAQQFSALTGEILKLRHQILVYRKPYSTLRHDLDQLLPPHFLRIHPYQIFVHLPRYLRAMLVRAERATVNPAKDQEKARLIVPYQQALVRWQNAPPRTWHARELLVQYRWMIEEFKVSCFAQELKTACPVSAKRLDEYLSAIQAAESKGNQ